MAGQVIKDLLRIQSVSLFCVVHACKHNATLRREHAKDKVIVNPNKQEINFIVISYNLISTKLAEQNYFVGVHSTVRVISS